MKAGSAKVASGPSCCPPVLDEGPKKYSPFGSRTTIVPDGSNGSSLALFTSTNRQAYWSVGAPLWSRNFSVTS